MHEELFATVVHESALLVKSIALFARAASVLDSKRMPEFEAHPSQLLSNLVLKLCTPCIVLKHFLNVKLHLSVTRYPQLLAIELLYEFATALFVLFAMPNRGWRLPASQSSVNRLE